MKMTIKLERDILRLKLDEERSFSEQKDEVRDYLLGMKKFLSGSDVKFSCDGVDLTYAEEMELCEIADEVFDRRVNFCYKKRPPESLMRHILANGERYVKKIVGTVRAGELIESVGDIIVIGDVNPTAQLVAYGDIFVIGNLRGVAHAGCNGNEESVIYAMGMNPVMLKISDKIGFNDEMSRHNANGIAKLENGEIKVKMI